MKLTWISEYDARPGDLIEWQLHPATIAMAAQSALDPRPASYMQEAHLRMAAMTTVGVDAPTWLGTAFDIPGVLDFDALEAALLQWLARHETLRSGLRMTAEHQLERFTLSPDDVALDRNVIDHFACGDRLVRYLEDRFDEATNPLTWPPYLFVTVGREDSFTVYLGFDHSNVDGYSIVQIPHEIHELYAAAVAGRPAELTEVGSYVDFSKVERESADSVDRDNETVVRWREFVEACGGDLPPFPLDMGVTPGDLPRQAGVCEPLLDLAGAEAFGTACRTAGGNFLAGVLAAAAVIAYERAGQSTYRTIIPLHTRTEEQWATSLGWYVGLAPIEIATHEARDFTELIGMANTAIRAARALAQVPFPKICALLDAPVSPASVVSYMDGRKVPGAAQWGQWKAHGFGKVSYGNETYVWVNRTVNGLYMTSRYPSTDLGHATMSAFIEHARRIFGSVAQTGTYDFADTVPSEHAAA